MLEVTKYPCYTKMVLDNGEVHAYYRVESPTSDALVIQHKSTWVKTPSITTTVRENALEDKRTIITRKEFTKAFYEVRGLINKIKP